MKIVVAMGLVLVLGSCHEPPEAARPDETADESQANLTVIEADERLKGSTDVEARRRVAGDLLRSGEYDRALQQYVWLWQNSLQYRPSYRGVRRSFMASEIERLCKEHEPAREAFVSLIDALDGHVRTATYDQEVWRDWFELSERVENDAHVLAWYDEYRQRPDEEGVGPIWGRVLRVRDALYAALERQRRLADALPLISDLRAKAREIVKTYRFMQIISRPVDAEENLQIIELHAETLRHNLTALYGAALAAGRREEAQFVAEALFTVFDDAESRTLLVEAVVEGGVELEANHRLWIDEAEELGADVSHLRERGQ